MDFKKINIYTVRDFIDNLIEKIPPRILRPIIHVMYAIAGIIILFGIYYGAKAGYASAKQEGQELGKDTRTLFQEEIERTYNRKNRGVISPDISTIYTESLHEIEKIFPNREAPEPLTASQPQETLMKRDEEFKPKQELSGPPLEDISKPQRLPTTPKEDRFEVDSSLESSNYYEKALKETPNYNYRILERKSKNNFLTPLNSPNSESRFIQKPQKKEPVSP